MAKKNTGDKEVQPSLFSDGENSSPDGQPTSVASEIIAEKPASETAHEVDDKALRRHDGDLRVVRHPVEFAALVPVTWRISALSRKLWMFMISYSLQAKGVATDEGVTWRVALNTLKRDAAYDSNDLDHLRDSIRELQRTLVDWSSSARDRKGEIKPWSSTQLLGSVEFVIDVSGRHCVEWSLPAVLLRQIREHKQYYESSLLVATQISRYSTLALLSLASRYKTSPNGLTIRRPWREWVPIFTGESEEAARMTRKGTGGKKSKAAAEDGSDEKYREFRYFNRDVISKAVAELNAVQDEFWVEPLPGRKSGSRTIHDLQFRIITREDYKPPAKPAYDAMTGQALDAMVELGLTKKFALELADEHSPELCLEVAEQVKKRVADGSQATIKKPEGYFVTELHKAAEAAKKLPPMAQPANTSLSVDEALEETLKDFQANLISEARAKYPDVPIEVKMDYEARFERESLNTAPPSVQSTYKKSGIKAPLISSRFFSWLAKEQAGDGWMPSAGELLAFERSRAMRKK
ncbi:replication initiation protein [Paucibacter soli]|uniref:replication initiation protein n=1 Tax=Paucibacter soli TaxID=3133433 RepID=UPI0030A9347A